MSPATQTKIAIATFVVLSGAALATRASLRDDGLSKEAFYQLKRSWQGEFDLVVAGDSRVARGVSPRRMQRLLPETRIGNLGFDANSLVYRPYLDYVVSTLDPHSETRTIVLGVDPYELTPRSTEINGFIEYSRKPSPKSPGARDGAQAFWDALAPLQLRKMAVPGETRERFDDRGFIETDRIPVDETARLPRYRVKFDGNQVEAAQAKVLLDAVEQWSQQGIRVIGFAPPVSESLA